MPVRVVTSRAQQPVTVNALVKQPRIIAERTIMALSNQFVMDQVFRNAGNAVGGAVQFRKASGIFADSGSEKVNEGAEIPLVTRTRGDLDSVPVEKRALGVEITREMRARNAIGDVDAQITAVRNTIVRDIDGAFADTLLGEIPGQTRTATDTWDTTTATIRKDINAAKLLVNQSKVAGVVGDNYYGWQPDTIILHPNAEAALLDSDEFLHFILGTTAATNIDSLPQRILGLRPFTTWGIPEDKAVVMQSKVVGGYSDEFPLETSELYWWQPRQIWRSDTLRSTAGFIDAPTAAAVIDGIL